MRRTIRLLSEHKNTILVRNLGTMSYRETLAIQQGIAHSLKINGGQDTLLLVEHNPPIYTMGRKDSSKDILMDEIQMQQRGIQCEKTTRGGAVTWHGPGQLVGYPILHLAHFQKNVRWYVHSIEKMLVKSIAKIGISSSTTSDVGVWVEQNRKIAAIGISLSRWITMHGFALNVNNDLSFFDSIIPCGLKNLQVTSISKELGKELRIPDIIPHVLESFAEVFEVNLKFQDPKIDQMPQQ